jgi:hypothetical protein
MNDTRKRTALGFALAPFAALLVLFFRLTFTQRELPPLPLILVALIFMYIVQLILALPLHFIFRSNGIKSVGVYLAIGALAAATPVVFALPHPSSFRISDTIWQISMGWAAALTFWWIVVRQATDPGSHR